MRGDKFVEILKTKVKVLEVTRQADDQITVLVDRNDLPLAVKTLYYDIGGFISTMIPSDERTINGCFALYYALSMEGGKMTEEDDFAAEDKCFITVKTLIPGVDPTFPSVTPLVPACVWYEREAYDMFGLVAEGLPDKRRLVLSDDWPDGLYPLRKDAMDYRYRPDPVAHQDEPETEFLFPKGDSVIDVPLGPLHVTSDEPGHFRLFCDGDEIIDASYGIMIARGDLGIEVPIERIPGIQRNIIRKCISKRAPVIVATQMLHTMINNPRPTRAEVTDIANAIYSYTDALMLSGETASGKYPIEACRTMATIAERAEKDAHREGFLDIPLSDNMEQREFLAKSAIEATEHLGVKGIITDGDTGKTARNLAAFRGPNPVLAICYHDKLQRWLNLSYGLIPVYQQEKKSKHELFTAALRMLRQRGYIAPSDKIAYISGELGKGGVTTFLEINTVSAVFEDSYKARMRDK